MHLEKNSPQFFLNVLKILIKFGGQKFPHSLGSFFTTFTEFCGFKPQSDEWKLMGASAYGDEKILQKN